MIPDKRTRVRGEALKVDLTPQEPGGSGRARVEPAAQCPRSHTVSVPATVRGMVIPSDEEIRALHERYAPTRKAFDLVLTHCEIVCAIAEQLLDRSDLAL